jgi:tripartite-type tricarboxylate transporter receptor subunit TctC
MHIFHRAPWTAAAAVIAAALMSGTVGPVAAQPVADFYKGKQVNLIIGYGVGGGYDQYARVLARYLGPHIPGDPNVVVQNMPGAGSRKAANWLYNIAPKDGSVLATLGQNTPTDQALGQAGIQFDANKFNWLGNMVVVNNTLAVWHTTGVKTIEEATKKELAIGATGASSPSVLYPQVANNLLGTKFKIISGYPGGGDINLALERGEVDGRGSNSWASWKSTKAEWLRDKKVNILFQVGLTRESDLPDVPLLSELGKTAEERQILEVISADVAVGRPILTTPDVPSDRVAALRKAFDETIADKAFLAEAEKQKMDINPLSGAELQQIVAKVLAHSPEVIAKVKQAITIKDMKLLPGAKPEGAE